MPSRTVVQDFVAMIEGGSFLEALSKFYAEDMSAQENNEPPRAGRAAQLANEQAFLKRVKRFDTIKPMSFLVDGDRVAIHYLMELTTLDGQHIRLEEIAYQLWRGEQIVNERYFYDPAQRQPRP